MAGRKKKVIGVEVLLSGGIDESNKLGDTLVDIRITRDFTLRHIHESICSLIAKDEEEFENIEFFLDTTQKMALDLDKTVMQIGLADGDRIIAQSKRRYKRARKTEPDEVDKEGDNITLTCTTRVFQNEGLPIRRVRVVVKKHHTCIFLMNDVANLWNKSGLKFRYGRTVLIANKTYEELGIEEDGEVIVTGART